MSSGLQEIKNAPSRPRIPEWIRMQRGGGEHYTYLKNVSREYNLHSVCEEAKCPNLGECWSHGAATFMLMGDICTRRCHFCSVGQGRPAALDADEPEHIATVVAAMGLKYCVLTSVARDDLPDQGADHIAKTIEAIHAKLPTCKLEMLVPDFRGVRACVERVVQTPLTVFAHNVETVPRLHREVRNGAIYERSLATLTMAKEIRSDVLTKSGMMLGLGETREEVLMVCEDLRRHSCDILTLGQYLQPTREQLPVVSFITPQEFADLRRDALKLGFRHVEAGPLVRSSYHAWQHVQ